MKTSYKLALLASAAMGLAASAAFAQDTAPASAAPAASDDSTVVVVTARRREESLKDVPVAVTSYSAEKLARIGAPDITSLQQTTPNLTLQVARGSNSTLIAFIRGIGQQDPLWGFDPGVGLYVDDVYIARPQGAVLDIYDVQRVEVLRGPQGTLYGRNTIGGAVKYVTKPLNFAHPEFDAKVNLGSYNQRDVILSGSVPLSDTFAIGGAVAREQHDGWGKNLYTGADQYNKDVTAYRLSAEWKPNDQFDARLNYDNFRDDSNARHGHREVVAQNGLGGTKYTGADAPMGLPTDSVYDTWAGLGDKNKVTNDGTALTLTYKLNDVLTFKSITAARKGHTDTNIDFDGTPAPMLDVPAYYADSQVSQEFQVIYSGEHWTTVGGLYYLNSTAEGAFDTIVGNVIDFYNYAPATYFYYKDGLTAGTAGKVRTQSWAAFFDSSLKVSDKLSLSIGGRYTDDHKTGTVFKANYAAMGSPLFGNSSAPLLLGAPPVTNYTNDREDVKFTPRVSLSYAFTPAITGYASISTGFKSGGFDMRGDASKTPDTVNGYKPESVITDEIGLKGSVFDNRLTFATDIFSSKYTDVQITRQVGVGTSIVSQVENAGKAKMDGFEFEGTFRLSSSLSASANIGYIDPRYVEYFSYDPVSKTISNVAGTVGIQNTPKWTNSFSATWSATIAGGRFTITPTAAFRGDSTQFETPLPLLDQKAYWLYNLGASWTAPNGHYRIGVYGLNLSDERYKVGGYNFPGGTYGNTTTAFYGAPKTWTVSLEYKY